MFANKTKVLLVLPAEVLDRARVLAGKATTQLKLPVSLQIVLRALIEEGMRREAPGLFENFERQARAVRDIRRAARERRYSDVAVAPARPDRTRAAARTVSRRRS